MRPDQNDEPVKGNDDQNDEPVTGSLGNDDLNLLLVA